MVINYIFVFYFATFSTENVTGLDAGLDGKIKMSISISGNQIREFSSPQYFWDTAIIYM